MHSMEYDTTLMIVTCGKVCDIKYWNVPLCIGDFIRE